MTGSNHLKYMLLGGAALFGGLLVFGVPMQSALLFAIVLACPMMMIFMMGGHGDHASGGDERGPLAERHDERDDAASHGRHHH